MTKTTVLPNLDEDTLVLHGLSHHEFCNRSKDMQHGEHGTVKLLKLSIEFAKYIFPSCTRLKLQDTSGYHDRHLGSIDLATKSMLLYGMTWYQKHLQDEAVLKPASQQNQETAESQSTVGWSSMGPGRPSFERDLKPASRPNFFLLTQKCHLSPLCLPSTTLNLTK